MSWQSHGGLRNASHAKQTAYVGGGGGGGEKSEYLLPRIYVASRKHLNSNDIKDFKDFGLKDIPLLPTQKC